MHLITCATSRETPREDTRAESEVARVPRKGAGLGNLDGAKVEDYLLWEINPGETVKLSIELCRCMVRLVLNPFNV